MKSGRWFLFVLSAACVVLGVSPLRAADAQGAAPSVPTWPPTRAADYNQLAADGRRIDCFHHGSRAGWGYEHDYQNSFYVVNPKEPAKNAPLLVILHSANQNATIWLGFETLAQPANPEDKGSGPGVPDGFYGLFLNSSNEEWWGWSKAKSCGQELTPAEKRVLNTVEWVAGRYNVDRNRVYLTGVSMGGCGSLGIGLPHGDIFAAVRVWVPAGTEFMAYRMGFTPPPPIGASPEATNAWLRSVSASGLPDPPVLVDFSAQNDGWSKDQDVLIKASIAGRLPLVLGWSPFGHSGARSAVVSTLPGAAAYEFPWLEIRRNEAYPVFTDATSDQRPPFLGQNGADEAGQMNVYFRWKNVADNPAAFAMDVWIAHPAVKQSADGMPQESVADVTFRRLQQFKVQAGAAYEWQVSRNGRKVASGTARPNAAGLLTIPRMNITMEPCQVEIRAQSLAATDRDEKPVAPAKSQGESSLTREQLFRKTGTDTPESFQAIHRSYRFDVVNPSRSHLMVAFEPGSEGAVSPRIVRLAPGARQTVELTLTQQVSSSQLSYAIFQSARPFVTHTNRYRACNDGETVRCVPVTPETFNSMLARTESILNDSKTPVTDKAMPPNTAVYTPGPAYRAAGIFARDFLYQLEGSGRDTVTADEVKRAVDFMALKQLTENRKIGAFTYPKGAIPDHIYPDGRWCWGPGAFYGENTAHFHRPSMDEAMCFITLGWHYGYKAGWDAAWQAWFNEKADAFADAWHSVPRNPVNGLVTQWTTAGHVGGSGINETNAGCVMWGFHDSYGFGGDDVGVSVLACNAARALADMHELGGDAAKSKEWNVRAISMRDAIRGQFHKEGYLPWGVGKDAPTMASPDITGYAVWSGILRDEQADAASDWFAARYRADRAVGGAADLFHLSAPFRGAVRMARKADDVTPGKHVWPHVSGEHWENLAYGYNAYQDGGYWYYMSLGVAVTLARKHPDLAREWVGNAYADLAAADANPPYERIDGMTPVNNRYNASIGQLMGMGMPAAVSTLSVAVAEAPRIVP